MFQKYGKTILAVLAAAIVATQAVITDGITPQEWLTIIVAAGGAAGVFYAPAITKASRDLKGE
jgi:hypothetical protein